MKRQRLGDLDHLLLGHGEVADLASAGRAAGACARTARGAFALSASLVEEEAAARARLAADEDVLGDRQVGHQVEFLVDDADAQLLRRARDVGISTVSPSNADRRRRPAGRSPARIFISVDLPAPFSPTSAWTSPAADRTRVVEGVDAGERLADPVHLDEQVGRRGFRGHARFAAPRLGG